MGNIHKLWFEKGSNGDWKHSKCNLDDDGGKRPFMLPYIHFLDNECYWQLKLLGDQYPGYIPCGIYACDLNFKRLPISNFMLAYPANWNLNVGYSGTRLLTFHDPQWWGPCRTAGVTQYNEDCCVIDFASIFATTDIYQQYLYQAADGNGGTIPFDDFNMTLHYNNATYDIMNGEMPPGWAWAETWPFKYIFIPCGADVSQAHINVSYRYVSGGPHVLNQDFSLDGSKKCCADAWPTYSADCSCYFEFTPTQYAVINQIVVNATPYNATAILQQTPSGIPYFSPAIFHYQNGAGNWIVPVDCILDTATIQFNNYNPPVTTGYPKDIQEICVNHFGVRNLTCWRWEIQLCAPKGGASISLYSEPWYCSDECAIPTLQISSDYCGADWDITGKYGEGFVFAIDDYGDIHSGGLHEPIKNTLRIPAILRKLPSKFNFSRNDKCNNYRSEVTETYSLKGTMPYPPYFAEMVENIMGGKQFFVSDVEYKIVSDSVFKTINVQGMSTLQLDAQLEKCPARVYFDCECCVPAEGRAC